MPDTYLYKGRDTGGKLVSGTVVADNESLVMTRLREMGVHPGPGPDAAHDEAGDQPAAQGQDEGPRGVLAPVRHDGEQRTADPAGALGAGAADRVGAPAQGRGRHPRRTSRAVPRCRRRSRSTRRSSTACTWRWFARVRWAASWTRSSSDSRTTSSGTYPCAIGSSSAMTYPIVVLGFVGMILIAMLVFIVPQFKAIYADLHGTLPLLTRILLAVSEVVRTKFWLVAARDRGAGLRAEAMEEERARSHAVGPVQAEGPGLRPAVPEDRALAVHADPRRPEPVGRADPAEPGGHLRDGQQRA